MTIDFEILFQLWTLKGIVDETSPLENSIIPAKKNNIAKARVFANTIAATNMTNIIAGLRYSLKVADWGQKKTGLKEKPLVIFLTDGEPNVETTDPEEIIKEVKKLNVDK